MSEWLEHKIELVVLQSEAESATANTIVAKALKTPMA